MSAIPSSPLSLCGRDDELDRIANMLARVPAVVIYGVGGVGKTTLAVAAAHHWPGGCVYHRVVAGEPLGAMLDDVRRELAGGRVVQAAGDTDRLDDLAERLDARGALMVVDDAHRLDPADQRLVFGQLLRRLRRGRLIATARERVAREVDDPDWFELRLGGVDRESGRAMWAALDELYGVAGGYDAAWTRSRGSPFLLRRAHAGDLDDTDPAAAPLAGLSRDERRLAGALALAEVRLTASIVAGLLPAPRPALQRLAMLLIVDVDGVGSCAMHDLYRDAMLALLDTDERRALHSELARLIRDAELPPVERVREVCRHLRAAGCYEAAGALLLEQAPTLIRLGAATELVRGVDAIPEELRSSALQVARARTLGRLVDAHTAYAELDRLVRAGVEPRHELRLAAASVALDLARLADAERLVRDVLADPALSRPLRVRAQVALPILRAHRGHLDEARELVRGYLAHAETSLEIGFAYFTDAYACWLYERDGDVEAMMERAHALFAATPASFRAGVLAPAFFTAYWARLGRFADADEAARASTLAVERDEDVRMRLYLAAMRADSDLHRGDRARSLAALTSVGERFERSGYTLGRMWSRALAGRVLMMLGRRREATAMIDQVETAARELGVGSVIELAARARREDPVAQLIAEDAAPVPESKLAFAVRRRALDALRAAAAGDTHRARALVDANREIVQRDDYAVERAIATLAMSIEQHAAGDFVAAEATARTASEIAAAAAIDPDLLPALRAAVGDVRLVTSEDRVVARVPTDLASYDAVIDGRSHELRIRRKVVSLRRRSVLRKLLYTLASQPDRVFTKEELALAVWTRSYNPLVNDNPLFVTIVRLRALLERSGLDVQLVDNGYRLVVPPRFLYIDPPRR